MGKIKKLIKKYENDIDDNLIQHFLKNDPSSTKKYFEYMLKMYPIILKERKISFYPEGMVFEILVFSIKEFDMLLPYIEDKDIYSPKYKDFTTLCLVIKNAREDKQKSLLKKEILIIFEDDKMLMIHPLTHESSMKYGANTTWCTTSKDHPGTFNTYKYGWLVYVIIKNVGKIALHTSPYSFNDDIETFKYDIYNEIDKKIDAHNIKGLEWFEVLEMDTHYRNFVRENLDYKKHQNTYKFATNGYYWNTLRTTPDLRDYQTLIERFQKYYEVVNQIPKENFGIGSQSYATSNVTIDYDDILWERKSEDIRIRGQELTRRMVEYYRNEGILIKNTDITKLIP